MKWLTHYLNIKNVRGNKMDDKWISVEPEFNLMKKEREGMVSIDKVLEVFDEEEKLIPIRWRCGRAITTLRKALQQLKEE